jgi:hypothetical protein
METPTSVGIADRGPLDVKDEDDMPTVIAKATARHAIEVEVVRRTLEGPQIALSYSRASH